MCKDDYDNQEPCTMPSLLTVHDHICSDISGYKAMMCLPTFAHSNASKKQVLGSMYALVNKIRTATDVSNHGMRCLDVGRGFRTRG